MYRTRTTQSRSPRRRLNVEEDYYDNSGNGCGSYYVEADPLACRRASRRYDDAPGARPSTASARRHRASEPNITEAEVDLRTPISPSSKYRNYPSDMPLRRQSTQPPHKRNSPPRASVDERRSTASGAHQSAQRPVAPQSTALVMPPIDASSSGQRRNGHNRIMSDDTTPDASDEQGNVITPRPQGIMLGMPSPRRSRHADIARDDGVNHAGDTERRRSRHASTRRGTDARASGRWQFNPNVPPPSAPSPPRRSSRGPQHSTAPAATARHRDRGKELRDEEDQKRRGKRSHSHGEAPSSGRKERQRHHSHEQQNPRPSSVRRRRDIVMSDNDDGDGNDRRHNSSRRSSSSSRYHNDRNGSRSRKSSAIRRRPIDDEQSNETDRRNQHHRHESTKRRGETEGSNGVRESTRHRRHSSSRSNHRSREDTSRYSNSSGRAAMTPASPPPRARHENEKGAQRSGTASAPAPPTHRYHRDKPLAENEGTTAQQRTAPLSGSTFLKPSHHRSSEAATTLDSWHHPTRPRANSSSYHSIEVISISSARGRDRGRTGYGYGHSGTGEYRGTYLNTPLRSDIGHSYRAATDGPPSPPHVDTIRDEIDETRTWLEQMKKKLAEERRKREEAEAEERRRERRRSKSRGKRNESAQRRRHSEDTLRSSRKDLSGHSAHSPATERGRNQPSSSNFAKEPQNTISSPVQQSRQRPSHHCEAPDSAPRRPLDKPKEKKQQRHHHDSQVSSITAKSSIAAVPSADEPILSVPSHPPQKRQKVKSERTPMGASSACTHSDDATIVDKQKGHKAESSASGKAGQRQQPSICGSAAQAKPVDNDSRAVKPPTPQQQQQVDDSVEGEGVKFVSLLDGRAFPTTEALCEYNVAVAESLVDEHLDLIREHVFNDDEMAFAELLYGDDVNTELLLIESTLRDDGGDPQVRDEICRLQEAAVKRFNRKVRAAFRAVQSAGEGLTEAIAEASASLEHADPHSHPAAV